MMLTTTWDMGAQPLASAVQGPQAVCTVPCPCVDSGLPGCSQQCGIPGLSSWLMLQRCRTLLAHPALAGHQLLSLETS